jgi:hypothetical protein
LNIKGNVRQTDARCNQASPAKAKGIGFMAAIEMVKLMGEVFREDHLSLHYLGVMSPLATTLPPFRNDEDWSATITILERRCNASSQCRELGAVVSTK